jgi:hypothetical protein
VHANTLRLQNKPSLIGGVNYFVGLAVAPAAAPPADPAMAPGVAPTKTPTGPATATPKAVPVAAPANTPPPISTDLASRSASSVGFEASRNRLPEGKKKPDLRAGLSLFRAAMRGVNKSQGLKDPAPM